MLFRRLAAVTVGLAMVLSCGMPAVGATSAGGAARAGTAAGSSTLTTPGAAGKSSPVPPLGALTSAQAAAAVTKYFAPPPGATVNADYMVNGPAGRRPTWNINWSVNFFSSGFGDSYSGMFADVDAMTGRILTFNRQSYRGTGAQALAVKYSYKDAMARARQVLSELVPGIAGQVSLEKSPVSQAYYGPFSGNDYEFVYTRMENGLPVWENGVDIGVNADTGKVDSYDLNWTSGVVFPAPHPAVSPADATQDWWKNGGLELNYLLPAAWPAPFGNGATLAWVMKDGGVYVNAATGKTVDSAGKSYSAQGAAPAIPAPTVPVVSLPPGGLADQAAALSWAQKVLPIPDGYQVDNVGQGQATGPAGQVRKMWEITWSKSGQPMMSMPPIEAGFTAASGRLTDYNAYGQGGGHAVSYAQALAGAVDFLAATGVDVATGYRLNRQSVAKAVYSGVYLFNFSPTPNGIPVNTGGLTVNVDAATGRVVTCNNFGNLPDKWPSLQEILSPARARAVFTKNITLRLGYLAPETGKAAILAYGVPARFAGAVVNARTGEVTDEAGTNLLVSGLPADVTGSWAADYVRLALHRGLMAVDADGLFHPDSPVTRGEAVEMILKATGLYRNSSSPAAHFADVPSGSPYYLAVEDACQQGLVLKAARFHPDAPVTREDFAVLVMRVLDYEAVGTMALRVPLPYRDAARVDPADANYVALAAGLGVFKGGGDFRPLDPLTRAEAAAVLVRLPWERVGG